MIPKKSFLFFLLRRLCRRSLRLHWRHAGRVLTGIGPVGLIFFSLAVFSQVEESPVRENPSVNTADPEQLPLGINRPEENFVLTLPEDDPDLSLPNHLSGPVLPDNAPELVLPENNPEEFLLDDKDIEPNPDIKPFSDSESPNYPSAKQTLSPTSDFPSEETETVDPQEAEFDTFPVVTSQDNDKINMNMSPWGSFQPGSWCRTRTLCTSFEEGKPLKSSTETKWTLDHLESDGYVLKREVSIKMGLSTYTKDPELIKYDFLGNLYNENQEKEKTTEATNLVIARKVIPCYMEHSEQVTPQWKESTTRWYSTVTAPYQLQKDTRTFSLPSQEHPTEQLLSYSITQVLKTSANLILGNNLITYRSQTITQKGSGTSYTTTVHSTRIPGSVLRETTRETDADGKILYLSNTVLLGYYIENNGF